MIFTVILVALYSAAGIFLVPYLIRSTLPEYLAEKLQVIVTISEARFNPFTFKLSVTGLIAETNEPGEPPAQLLSTGNINIDFDLLSLLRGDLVCSNMDIDRFNIKLTRHTDKRYNISYLLQGKGVRNHSEIMDFAELPFLFSLNNIKVTNSQIIFDDKSTGKIHHIENMEIALPAISNFQYQTDNYIHPQFSAVINGSPIKLSGEATIGSSTDDGRQTLLSCDLDDIDIPLYFDYLPVALPVDVIKGKANGTLQISFSPEQKIGSKLKIKFNVSTTDLGIESRNSKLSISVPNAKLEGSLEPFNQTLTIQNILLREPTLTSEGVITRETLANLAPLTKRPDKDDPLYQVIPSISIKLLIADGGSVIIRKPKQKKPLRIWHSIQLSIKNFSNITKTEQQDDSTFRLNGEHLASSAFFTWQGQFNKDNRPSGSLQLSNMPASIVAPFLAKKAKDIKGTADLTGLLSITLSEIIDKPFDYSLKSTKLTIKDLHLSSDGVEWINVPNFRCEPVSIIKNVTDLGNVYMQNSFVTIYKDKLPYLLKSLTTRPSQHIIHGIDFSGTIQIKEKKTKNPLVKLRSVVLQANRLEQKKVSEENFVFSASLTGGGDIKTKGILHTSPLQISSQLSFSKLSPRQVFLWFTDSVTLKDSQAILSAKGTYRYPQKEFNGFLEADELIIGHVKNPVFRSSKVRFDNFFWSHNEQKLSIKYLLVDQPEFSWNRTKDATNLIAPVSVFLRHIFLPEPDNSSSDPDKSLARFTFNIDQIDLSDGAISYQDLRTSPPLALGLTGINGRFAKLQYPIAKTKTDFELTGNVEGYAFSLEGDGMLMQYPPSARVAFTSQQIPMSIFSKQLENQAKDFDLSKSRVNINSSFNIEDRLCKQDTTLTFNNITPVKQETPASTALALMTDTSGNLIIQLPSKTNECTKPVITDALSNINRSTIKASINPMLIAGDAFSDLVTQQFISFRPGTAEITGEGIERLNRFGEFLAHYPLTKLTIKGYADTSIDTPALYEKLSGMEQERIDQENNKRRAEWQKLKDAEDELSRGKPAPASTQIQETDLPITQIEPFVPLAPKTIKVTNSKLNDLAAKREQIVLNFFTDQLSLKENRIEKSHSKRNVIQKDGNHARVLIQVSDLYKNDSN